MIRKPLALMACLLMFAATATAQTDFREALRISLPATVSIQTSDAEAVAPDAQQMLLPGAKIGAWKMFGMNAQQTGFAVGSDLIATQLASDIDEVTIQTEQTQLTGKVVARDYVTGLSIVRVADAKFVSLVVGAGIPEAGLPVVITRLDRARTPSGGLGMIASGPTAVHPQLGFTQLVSASMNRSDIGAPIVDATGVVVGIVGSSAEGGLLCVPTAQLIRLIDAAAGDDVNSAKRGLVGVVFAKGHEPVVTNVTPDTPADTAGLQVGDRVLQVGDYKITTSEEMLAAVAMFRAGDDVSLQVERDGKTLELTVKLKEHPHQEFAHAGGATGGFAQRAWELRDGKLVPLNPGGNVPGVAPLQPLLQQDLQKMLENFPNRDLIVPRLPGQLEGFNVERSDLEDSLRKLEDQKQKQADELEDVKKKLRDLQEKLEDL